MVVLVTGSSRGLGKELVLEYAKRGLDVVINYYKSESKAKTLEKYINENYPVKTLCIKADVSKEEEVEEMFNKIIDEFGRIDILVNNASISKDTNLNDIKVVEFQRILNVNLIGTYLCSKYASKFMLENKKGVIVNISSTNGINTYEPNSAQYDASQAAIINLTHNMAKEYAPFIRVNCICHGIIDNDRMKELSMEQIRKERRKVLLNKFANYEDITKSVIFISSKESSYINDSIIRIDGGYNC